VLQSLLVGQAALLDPEVAYSGEEADSDRPFLSAAFPKRELTNSIIASRDTNISPMEVYDVLRAKLNPNSKGKEARALDVGAGAGVSTQVFYEQLGYTNIDAVDWSGSAWEANVVEGGYCPPSVNFYELDDERFYNVWKEKQLPKYDIIAFNFGVNKDKALFFCKNLLEPNGLLLAPINTQKDYWLKQTYQLLDASGNATWSANDVGAWAVQFQPDVTAETCQGIWCAPFNGFVKLKNN
jgi:SAM-dependent methyltransferase